MPFKKGWSDEKKAKEKKAVEVKKEIAATAPASPIYKAFYIMKDKGSWHFVMADIQDDKVISKKSKDCENKALSLENFKIEFARYYYFGR